MPEQECHRDVCKQAVRQVVKCLFWMLTQLRSLRWIVSTHTSWWLAYKRMMQSV
jgi:hypothetical protein